jgi:hypothetical protein
LLLLLLYEDHCFYQLHDEDLDLLQQMQAQLHDEHGSLVEGLIHGLKPHGLFLIQVQPFVLQ